MSQICRSTAAARRLAILAAAACFALSANANCWGVIVRDGSPNNTPPPSDPGFNNVGVSSSGGASVTYLGNGWIITANHVSINATPVSFGGVPYAVDLASKVILKNTDNSNSDLAMYRLTTSPPLPTLTIGSAAMSAGDPLLMVGNGRTRGAQRNWNVTQVTPTNWIWAEDVAPTTHSGFNVDGGNVIRWGNNNVRVAGLFESDGFNNVHDVRARFDNDAVNLPKEAHVASGDSGGAVFSLGGNNTAKLTGIMLASADFPNQPASTTSGLPTVVFGNETGIADLSFYRSQIVAIVPEPGSFCLAAGGAVALAAAAWRSRRRWQ